MEAKLLTEKYVNSYLSKRLPRFGFTGRRSTEIANSITLSTIEELPYDRKEEIEALLSDYVDDFKGG